MEKYSERGLEEFFLSSNKILKKIKKQELKTASGKEITEHTLRKAIDLMDKRHHSCRWKFKIGRNTYVLIEGVYWLIHVYFQKENDLLDADIKFFIERIEQYEKLLNITSKNFWNNDMSVNELGTYFNKAIKTIKNNIYRMNKQNNKKFVYIKNNKLIVSKLGVEWLCKNCFKDKYLSLLEEYKMELTERYKAKGNIYDFI